MQVLVFGSGGMLGTEVCKLLDVVCAKSDITRPDEVVDEVLNHGPDVIVNCAAYTAVDAAEDEPNQCFSVNMLGARNLVNAANRVGAHLVHISTDYVFGDSVGVAKDMEPFEVDAEPAPLGVYGWSKFGAEECIKANATTSWAIIRTSWLHGPAGKNFLETILNASKKNDELKVVNDQFGSPTYTVWLAELIKIVANKKLSGVFHGSSRGTISWFDFAKEIVSQAEVDCTVLPQSSAESGRTARRPAFSALSTSSLDGVIDVLSWKESVKLHLRSIA